ncbi:MAG: radical SAM protein [Candidatus Omnitrophica bacterium]|nr:radical SAM protein [Candidatus Omnitrophota bacterium]MCB9747284.1 radical SAM protein [Candidatus Omnitrophota bacterium]
MIKQKIKDAVRIFNTARLYARVGLTRLTPKQAYKMLNYWIRTHVFKQKIPWLIEFSVTYRCNARCEHCSVMNYILTADKTKELNDEEIIHVLKEAAKMGIPKVDFFGGEPMIRENIVELVKVGVDLGIYMSITTNGWFLTRDRVKALKKAGINCINVSIDSADEKEHDTLRRLPGVYKKAVEGIQNCHREGVPCIVSTYVTKNRIKSFADTKYDESVLTGVVSIARRLKATGVRILLPILSGQWVQKLDMGLNDEEKALVIENIDHSFVFIEGAYSVVKKKKVCQALTGKVINISPYGDMQLCIAYTNTFGRLSRQNRLNILIQNMWKHKTYVMNENKACCSTVALQTGVEEFKDESYTNSPAGV